MSSQVNDVFNAFVEAQKAMQRLPEAEAELARAKGEQEVTRQRLEQEWTQHDRTKEVLSATQSELSAKEAALRDATFREQQLRDQLSMLVSTFKAVVGEATAAVELVEPKPEPVTEPSPGISETDQSVYHPIPTDGAVSGNDPAPTVDGSQTASAASATDLPGTFQPGSGFRPDNEDLAYIPYGFDKPKEETVTPPENPTPAASIGGTTTTSEASAGFDSPRHPKSNANRPYWEKPSNVTWFDWYTSGGDLAPWCRHSTDDQLKSIFN